MRSNTLLAIVVTAVATLLVSSGFRSFSVQAQDGPAARISVASPMPVYVTNTPVLPEGFTAGSRWRYTTWTAPSVITWVGEIRQVSGPWAYVTVPLEGVTTTRWYYVPAMPGSWEKQ